MHFLKVPSIMEVTEDEIDTFLSDSHSIKAKLPNELTEEKIEILTS